MFLKLWQVKPVLEHCTLPNLIVGGGEGVQHQIFEKETTHFHL